MRQVGILQILLSGLCFGFLGIFGKSAYEQGLTPGVFLSLRFLLATSLLALLLAFWKPSLLKLPLSTALRAMGLGVFGYALFSSCYFYALNGLSASLTVLLLYTYPVLVSLGAWAIFGERLHRTQVLALPLVVGGMAMLVWKELEVREPFALLVGFLSAVFYSAYILTSSRLLRGVPPFSSVLYVMLGAGLTLSALHLRPESLPASAQAWGIVGATAVISTVCAMGLFLSALQKLKSAEVSLLSAAEPVTGVLLAALVLKETLSVVQWTGGALVVAGMLLVGLAKRA